MDKRNHTNYIKAVEEFHRTFNAPVLETPTIPDSKRCELRVNLIQEELNELKEAIDDNDIVEVADALCDIMYVLSGAVLEFGLKDQFDTLFNEVQRSNMSKACSTMEQATATVRHYKDKGTDCRVEKLNGKYIVYRQSDDKVMKNVEYSPADLASILNTTAS